VSDHAAAKHEATTTTLTPLQDLPERISLHPAPPTSAAVAMEHREHKAIGPSIAPVQDAANHYEI
jgi:hypothetical protein